MHSVYLRRIAVSIVIVIVCAVAVQQIKARRSDPCREQIGVLAKALSRYSVDHYTDRPVFPETLDQLVPKYVPAPFWDRNLLTYHLGRDPQTYILASNLADHGSCRATELGAAWLNPGHVISKDSNPDGSSP